MLKWQTEGWLIECVVPQQWRWVQTWASIRLPEACLFWANCCLSFPFLLSPPVVTSFQAIQSAPFQWPTADKPSLHQPLIATGGPQQTLLWHLSGHFCLHLAFANGMPTSQVYHTWPKQAFRSELPGGGMLRVSHWCFRMAWGWAARRAFIGPPEGCRLWAGYCLPWPSLHPTASCSLHSYKLFLPLVMTLNVLLLVVSWWNIYYFTCKKKHWFGDSHGARLVGNIGHQYIILEWEFR